MIVNDISARELAYATFVVGKQRGNDGSVASTVGVATYERLHEACLTDVQAITYLHQFEASAVTVHQL